MPLKSMIVVSALAAAMGPAIVSAQTAPPPAPILGGAANAGLGGAIAASPIAAAGLGLGVVSLVVVVGGESSSSTGTN